MPDHANEQGKLWPLKKIYAVAEVVVVLVFILLSGWGLRALKSVINIRAFQIQIFSEPIIVKAVFFILLPTMIIKVSGQERADYGIGFNKLSYHLEIKDDKSLTLSERKGQK